MGLIASIIEKLMRLKSFLPRFRFISVAIAVSHVMRLLVNYEVSIS